MQQREQYKDQAYFQFQLDENKELRNDSYADLQREDQTDQARQADLYFLYSYQYEDAQTLYCMGAALDAVAASFNEGLPHLADTLAFSLQNGLPDSEKEKIDPWMKMRILPWMILCDSPSDKVHEILDYTKTAINEEYHVRTEKDYHSQFDPLMAHLAAYLGYQAERISPELAMPEYTEKLYECFTRHAGHRPDILKDYMDNWLKIGSKGIATWPEIYIKDFHKPGVSDSFRGYWCWIAAAVAKVLEIDDRHLKDHPHYPFDLRHYKPKHAVRWKE